VLMTPRIVSGFYEKDRCVEKVEIRPIRRLMSPRTARRLTDCLTGVVEKDEGTGVSARIEGVQIAGKTGTAQKIDPVTKLYQTDKFVASFVGYFPAEAPQLLCIVMMDEPKDIHYGGLTAAPVFRNIVTRILHSQDLPYGARIFGQQRLLQAFGPAEIFVPDFIGSSREKAVALCNASGFLVRFEGTGERIVRQSLRAGGSAAAGMEISLTTEAPEFGPTETEKMPQLLGLPLRPALEKLQARGVRIRVEGNGMVIKQAPESGRRLEKNSICVIQAG
jgi:membrane peptidoglycan carboxypeptidase